MEKGNEQIHNERLKEQIAKAQATAPTEEELEKVLNEEAELNNLFLQGKINREELKKIEGFKSSYRSGKDGRSKRISSNFRAYWLLARSYSEIHE